MLNQERVILMTKMASYEANEGRKNSAVMDYFRGDYIWFQVLKSFICATIAFGIIFGMYIFYDFEIFMMDIYKMNLVDFGKSVITKYLLVLGVYSIISYAIYCYRYAKAKNSVKLYLSNLSRLGGMYEKT